MIQFFFEFVGHQKLMVCSWWFPLWPLYANGLGNNHYILYVGCKPPPRMPVANEGLVLSSWLVMIILAGKATPKIKGDLRSSSPEAIIYVRRQPFIFAKYPRHPKSSHTWWGWVWREPLKRPSPHEIFWGLNRHRSSHSVGQDVYRGICCIKMEFVFVVLRRGMADPLIWGPPWNGTSWYIN